MKYFFNSLLRFPILLIFIPLSLWAQESTFEIGGYFKNLASYRQGHFAGMTQTPGHFQNTVQGRLNLSWYISDNLTAVLQSRHLFTFQKNIKNGNNFFSLFSRSPYYFNFKKKWINDNHFQTSSEIDRFYLDWSWQNWQITLGRQRLVWGTCLVWNPTDLFNPFNILDFDYEEKPGTDALHAQYYLGPVSQIDLAVTPGKTKGDVIYAGRFLFNYKDYDLNLIGGWQKESLRLGFSWSGSLGGGGFRGELLYSKPRITYNPSRFIAQTLPFLMPDKNIDRAYFTAAFSYDYTFGNSFYWHSEYLYNGLGSTGNAAQRQYETLLTGELSPARHSLFQEFAYDITPLWRGDVFIIFNPNDRSWVAAPSMQYSLSDNWELYLLAFPSKGIKSSEFGALPSWYFVRIKFSF